MELLMKRQKKLCELCNRKISLSNFARHAQSCEGPKKKKIRGIDFDPNYGFKTNTRTQWNKGLTKETDERVKKNSDSLAETLQRKIANGEFIPRRLSQEEKFALSKRMSEHNPGGKSKWFEVSGVKVQGTWERDIAVKLNESCIKWVRPKCIKYIMGGKMRNYTPDFYLPDFDVYLEVKGYWWGNDKEKMECVIAQHSDKKFVIIMKEKFKQILQGERVW